MNSNSLQRPKQLLPVFAVSALAAALALQTSPAMAAGFALEEVVVSARKTDETLQTVPIAVSSFSSEEMQSLNLTNARDIAAVTPSVFIEPASANNGTALKTTIRGQVQTDTIITLDSSVGWYIDDVYLARAYATANSLFDVERIEVLKGPQGTLYGRNTTGGTIKLVTTKAEPSAGVTGYVMAGAGSFGAWKTGGAINLPLIEDKLAIRLTALTDQVEDGYGEITVRPTGIPTLPTFAPHEEAVGTKDGTLYRLGITWNVSDDLSVQALYEQAKLDVTMFNYNLGTQPGFAGDTGAPPNMYRSSSDYYKAALNALPRSQADAETAALTVEYVFSETLSTKLAYGYRHVLSSFMSDVDGTTLPVNYFMEPFVQNAEQHSLEWQLQGTAFAEHLDWMTGLYYFQERGLDQSISGSFGAAPNGFFPGLPANGANRFLYGTTAGYVDKNKSQSAFMNGTWHFTDSLRLNAGARYTEDFKPITIVSNINGYNVITQQTEQACRFDSSNPSTTVPNADPTNCTWANEDDYEFWSWNIGFDYDIAPDVLTYLKWSSATRSGGQNLRALTAEGAVPFKAETATDVELGIKGRFFDDQLQLNAAVYHTNYTDVQQSLLLSHPTGLYTQIVNPAKAEIDGVEMEATWLVTENFKLSASAALLNWKFEDSTSTLPAAPGEQYSAHANYSLPTAFGDWLFDLNYAWRDEYLAASTNRIAAETVPGVVVDSLGLLGARISIDIKDTGLNVAAWGRNLTDEEYRTSPLNVGNRFQTSTVGEPISYGVEATYKF